METAHQDLIRPEKERNKKSFATKST